MKRTNNKFRNNNNYNNQIYSLNYKFDSNSIAGKISGTALDLIKRYNELAKEAHTNNDYVSSEVFRQYAEHYRKIVTDINEKKNQNQGQNQSHKPHNNAAAAEAETANVVDETIAVTDGAESTINAIENSLHLAPVTVFEPQTAQIAEAPKSTLSVPEKKSFTVIEIPTSEAQALSKNEEAAAKPKRTYRRKIAAAE